MNRFAAALTSALLAVGLSAGAAHGASSVSVTGKLPGAKGFTVLAVSPDGSAVRAPLGAGGAFKLKVKGAKGATLQLVRPSGAYFGPIVLAKAKKKGKVHLALSGKAVKLGKLKLRASWAEAGPKVPARAIAAKKTARAAENGKPAGAGSLGLESRKAASKSSVARIAQAKDGGAAPDGGADTDADGLPNTVDVDDNANGILDSSDPSARGSDGLFTTLNVQLERSVNVNAGGLDAARIDQVTREYMRVNFYFDHRQFGGTVSSIDVNCFNLAYCRTSDGPAIMGGMVESGPLPEGTAWRTYDRNGNGLPDVPAFTRGDTSAISIQPNVPMAQINPGDLLDIVVATPNGTITRPAAIPPYFITSPALQSFDAGSGTQRVAYPATFTSAGAQGNPIQLAGDKLTLTFWRPQRRAIAGAEAGDYVDMGNLHYGIPIEAGGRQMPCAGHYSNLSPTLRETASGDDYAAQLYPLTDSAADAAPNAANTLSFTLDLGACMRANGVQPAGQSLYLGLTAGAESRPGGNDRTLQEFRVCLPGCVPESGGNGQPGNGQPGPGQPGAGQPSTPDLRIASLSAASEGSDCRVSFSVRNDGGATGVMSEVMISSGAGSVTASMGGLGSGQEAAGDAVFEGTPCSGMMIEARADSANQVAESDEGNNMRSQAF